MAGPPPPRSSSSARQGDRSALGSQTKPPRPIRRGVTPPSAGPVRRGPFAPGTAGTIRRVVWTAGIAIITITGAIYGAGLKTQQEYKAEKRALAELSPEARIAGLQQRRAAVVAAKMPLEKKLAEAREKLKQKQMAKDNQ